MTAPTPRPDESQPERITQGEMIELFGARMPVEAAALLFRDDLTAEQMREELRALAKAQPNGGIIPPIPQAAADSRDNPVTPSLAEIDAPPEKNRLVVAKLIGAKEHSGGAWRREGWAMMAWWGDRWNAPRMAEARETLDADFLDVEAWFYPAEIFTLRAEVSRLTDALAEAEARVARLTQHLAVKMAKPVDLVAEARATAEAREKAEDRAEREARSALSFISAIAATIPLRDVLAATRTGDDLVAYFKVLHARATAAEAALVEREGECARLHEAVKLALEYWSHRQQRYKNRHPAWVTAARAALAPDAEKGDRDADPS